MDGFYSRVILVNYANSAPRTNTTGWCRGQSGNSAFVYIEFLMNVFEFEIISYLNFWDKCLDKLRLLRNVTGTKIELD